MLDTDKQIMMKTAVEWLEERLNLSIGYELKPLRGFFVIAKEMERKQIEEAIADGYAGCCGKKATVKLKGNFCERKESWDERKSVNEIIVNSKNKPELKELQDWIDLKTQPSNETATMIIEKITEMLKQKKNATRHYR